MSRPRAALAALLAIAALGGTAASADAKYNVRGSANQVLITGAKPGQRLVLVDRRDRTVARTRAGRLGGAVFRDVPAGRGYRVERANRTTLGFRVFSSRPAPPRGRRWLHRQKIPSSGYGYLMVRDGTELAINVRLPGPVEDGPYPTLVEYSGYGYARPGSGESSIAQIANLLGFAVVDVNMRGTGCSGGAFDYFERLQSLDGYDVIETVARQPWVLHNRPGMMGISYGGISQLFVASTRPPSLAAIAPLSVIDDTATTLYPGGILNSGFALSWAKDRVRDALPASPTGGQAWALERIREGDRTCKANQVLHTEAVDLLAKIDRNRFYDPEVADPLAPRTFVHKIRTPVFLACQWTDEQTGGHCPNLADRFTGTSRKWMTFTNGTHIDALDPATFNRWYDFLSIYVARRAPDLPPSVRALAPTVFQASFGVPGVTLPDDPIQGLPTLAAARRAFEALPSVSVRFDNGAGRSPGEPYAGFERSFSRFPLPGTRARSWYTTPGGELSDAAVRPADRSTFTWNPAARPDTSFVGNTGSGAGGLWTATPPYRWLPGPPESSLTFTSAPLDADTAVVGAGALHGWLRSSTRDVDLQITVSEVRPDGRETFVQNGWLRASRRKLDRRRSTLLEPVPSLRRADAAPLPAAHWAKVAVPLYYQGHMYRQGSRIRLTVAAPGGDQPIWEFGDTRPRRGTARVSLGHGRTRASRLVLPVVRGVTAPTPLPPCPALRGQPCREAAR